MATPFLQLTLPVVSVTPGPDWAQSLNLAIITLDGHDHTSGFGARVPSAGLDIDSDLSFADHNGTNFRTIRFFTQASALVGVTDAGCLYVVGDDLFYNNGLGAAIQITSGGALSSIPTGNIQGDIGVGGSQLVYSSATKTFSFLQAVNNFAKISAADLLIHEAGVVSPQAITIKSPVGVAASFAVTLPASLPATNLPVQLSAAGNLSASQITNSMQNFGTPIALDDVATKRYVDSKAGASASHMRHSLTNAGVSAPQLVPTKFDSFTTTKTVGTDISADGTGRFTINTTGTYFVRLNAQINGNAGASSLTLTMDLRKNGALFDTVGFINVPAPPVCVGQVSGEVMLDLVATDFLEFFFTVSQSAVTRPTFTIVQMTVERAA